MSEIPTYKPKTIDDVAEMPFWAEEISGLDDGDWRIALIIRSEYLSGHIMPWGDDECAPQPGR